MEKIKGEIDFENVKFPQAITFIKEIAKGKMTLLSTSEINIFDNSLQKLIREYELLNEEKENIKNSLKSMNKKVEVLKDFMLKKLKLTSKQYTELIGVLIH